MPPEQLLTVKPITEVDGVLEYSERTMRTIAALVKPAVSTTETHSAFVRRFLQSLEPWTTVEKEQGGRMTKRIGAYIYKTYNHSLHANYVAGIGNFLNDEAPVGKLHYDQTNRFTWSAGEFGDGNACFLISRRNVLDAMMEEGAHALRFWKPAANDGHKGVGRAWVLPTKLGVPVVMNAYGPTLESYRARMRLIVPDAPTTMVMVNNFGTRDGSLYINGGHGFLVGHEGEDYSLDVDLEIQVGSDRPVRCHDCGQRVQRRNQHIVYLMDDSTAGVCAECYHRLYGECMLTGRHYPLALLEPLEMVTEGHYDRERGFTTGSLISGLANPRFRRNIPQCPRCNHHVNHHSAFYHAVTDEGGLSQRMCIMCASAYDHECTHCGNFLNAATTCSCGASGTHRPRSY
jgi:hypothetical protein